MQLSAESVDFGFMIDPLSMMVMHTSRAKAMRKIKFRLKMLYRSIEVEFPVYIPNSLPSGRAQLGSSVDDQRSREETFCFRIPFSQLKVIYEVPAKDNMIMLLISLDTPPAYYRELDGRDTHDSESRYWTEDDAWYRQTDIVCSPAELRTRPVALRKPKPIIDIGRF